MIRLQPDWVGELLGRWAAQDRHDAVGDLGFSSVSPMFARVLGVGAESEDVTGYSHTEVRAMAAAVEWLQLHHPEHWRALSREFRPASRATLPERSGDTALLVEAGHMLAKYIDEVLG